MRLPKFILIDTKGKYWLHYCSGEPSKLTLEQFVKTLRSDTFIPVYSEIA